MQWDMERPMTEERDQPQPGPASQAPDQPDQQDEPFGGEIRVTGGGTPRLLRWVAYALFVWAIAYLALHPPMEHRIIIWVWAGLMTVWLLFFALTNRPADP